jgi:ADP-ribosylglycohydrolase
LRQRYQGALLGLAAGDALGTTVEFSPPGTFKTVTDMVGGGPFHLLPGEWTDDTSMALCLAESLLESRGFSAGDQMQRYLRWWRHGHLSSNGRCFDIGMTSHAALAEFERTGNPYSGSTDANAAGNGSLMRLAAVPLYFAASATDAVRYAADSSRTTHGTIEAIDACRLMSALMVCAVRGMTKAELLDPNACQIVIRSALDIDALTPKIAAIARGSYKVRQPPAIRGSGYVVETLEAALWAFHKSSSFEEGALMAVNLGDDADTTGAVYGQLAGCYYGVTDIPARWLDRLAHRELITAFADRLHDAAWPT